MKRRDSNTHSEGGDTWLNTYADMITLLLTFFVLLFSMSSMSTDKWEALVEAQDKKEPENITTDITKKETIDDVELAEPTDFDELYRHLRDYIKANDLEDLMSAYRGSNYIFLRFKSNVFFEPDSSVLKQAAQAILDRLCDAMSGIGDKIGEFKVVGYTADVVSNSKYPISDRSLSAERANNVVEFIEAQEVIDPSKIISLGRGKYNPIGDNNTAEGQAQNRRVEIIISEVSTEQAAISRLYKEIAEGGTKVEEESPEKEGQEKADEDELTPEEAKDLVKA